MTRERYDVVIAGARVAGASTALLLARQGFRVLVIDRGRLGADTLSTHALMRSGVMQLRRWGLHDDLLNAGTPPVRAVRFTSDSSQISVTIKPAYGVDALIAPRRTVLDPLLVRAASEAGAEFRFGHAVVDLHRDNRGAVTGVVTRDRDGQIQDIMSGLVVGADGVRSKVASLVAAPVDRQWTGATSVVYGHWNVGEDLDAYEWIHRPNACAGLIPTNHKTACVFVAATPQRIGRGGTRVVREILAESAPGIQDLLNKGTLESGLRFHRALPGFVRRSWGQGWALVGDAGQWKDPIGAHGMSDALRDAELLSSAIAAGLSEGVGSLSAALADYQQTRDRIAGPVLELTDVMARQEWRASETDALVRQLNSAMAAQVEEVAKFAETPTR